MEYVQLTMEDYIQSKKEIKKDLGRIVKSFVRIGWQLTRINNSEAYKMDGYKTIAEFAKAEYGMNPSGVTRFMQVYEKYSVPGDTPELQDKYKDFNFSQLTEMLQLTEEERGMFQPESKREDIREYKNFMKENENNPDNLLNWRKEPEDLIGKTVLEFFRNNKELLNDLYGSEACTSGNLKDMVEIINPSGNRHYRHKTIFLMMYDCDKGLMVSEFGKIQESMTWKRFFEITKGIFQEAAAGSRTWENYFEPQKTADQEPTEEPEIAPAQKEPEKQEEPQEGQIPGQDSIENNKEWMPEKIIPTEDQYQALYESLESPEKAALDRKENALLSTMLFSTYGSIHVHSDKLNFRGTRDGMVFNPDTQSEQIIKWQQVANGLITLYAEEKPVRMADITEPEEDEEWNEDDWTSWEEAKAVKLYAEKYPDELKKIMKICRKFSNNGDRAKEVQKTLAPYEYSSSGDWDFNVTFAGFSKGVTIESDEKKQKINMKYGRFVVELLNLYDPYAPEFMDDEIAPAQQETEIPTYTCIYRLGYICTLTRAQQAAAGDGENCNGKCCWNCQNHGTCGYECNSSAHRPESTEIQKEDTERQQEEKPEEWPEDLVDIPVPSLTEITSILYDAERDLKDYLSCEGIPAMTILKMQLIAGGLRLIKNLVEGK